MEIILNNYRDMINLSVEDKYIMDLDNLQSNSEYLKRLFKEELNKRELRQAKLFEIIVDVNATFFYEIGRYDLSNNDIHLDKNVIKDIQMNKPSKIMAFNIKG